MEDLKERIWKSLEIFIKSDSDDEFSTESMDDDCFDDSLPTPEQKSKAIGRKKSLLQERDRLPSDEEGDEIIWEKSEGKRQLHIFDHSSCGCHTNLGKKDSILAFFETFFTAELMELIVTESNKFQEFIVANEVQAKLSRASKWTPLSMEELFCFFALTMLMSRIKKLSINEYWSKDYLIQTNIFGDVMPRDRYWGILSMLNFCDNTQPNYGDQLYKIRSVVNYLRLKFKESFSPSQNLCINESLVLLTGSLFFKQFAPIKRNKFGIKNFDLCDCKTGYVLDFVVNTGKKSEIQTVNKNLGKFGGIVATLMEHYLDRGHTLFVDSRFSSPLLFWRLFSKKTNVCGIVNKHKRKMPIMKEELDVGEITFRYSGYMLALKWMHNKEVWMLSTFHDPSMIYLTKKNKPDVTMFKPHVVDDYNHNMNAIDRTEMLPMSFEPVKRSVEWYKKIFLHLLDITVLNAHTLYKDVTGNNISLRAFHLSLIREILEKYYSERTNQGRRRQSQENPLRFKERHFPKFIPSTGRTLRPLKKFVVCYKNKIRRESRYQCEECNAALCVVPCFQIFHTR